jgi:hypothetical protein
MREANRTWKTWRRCHWGILWAETWSLTAYRASVGVGVLGTFVC